MYFPPSLFSFQPFLVFPFCSLSNLWLLFLESTFCILRYKYSYALLVEIQKSTTHTGWNLYIKITSAFTLSRQFHFLEFIWNVWKISNFKYILYTHMSNFQNSIRLDIRPVFQCLLVVEYLNNYCTVKYCMRRVVFTLIWKYLWVILLN